MPSRITRSSGDPKQRTLLQTLADCVPVLVKTGTRNSKWHKLTQNNNRVLHLCIHLFIQEENASGNTPPPKFPTSPLQQHASWAAKQHNLLTGLLLTVLLHGKQDIALQCLSSPWVSSLDLLFPFANSEPFCRTENC